MTKIKTLSAALIAATLIAPVASAGTLTVTLEDIKKTKGTVQMGIFDENGYETGEAVNGANVTIDEATETVTIEGLAPGFYGIKMFHDVNGDGEMNTNPFGMPTEPYAFSNNAKGRFGPAKWDAAKFEVTADGAVQTISIN
ncbi:MAG: DUF2141 domain-containing protein [Pseudomonadota bacterium]